MNRVSAMLLITCIACDSDPQAAPAAPSPPPAPRVAPVVVVPPEEPPTPDPRTHPLYEVAVAFLETFPDPFKQGDMSKMFKRACRRHGGTYLTTRAWDLTVISECNKMRDGLRARFRWRDRWRITEPGKAHDIKIEAVPAGDMGYPNAIATRHVGRYVPSPVTVAALARVAPLK